MLTTEYVPGSPVWVDLVSPDVEAAAAFYGALFGWTFDVPGESTGGWGKFALDGKTVAAAGPLHEAAPSPAWTPYFDAADAGAAVKAVEQGGGTVTYASLGDDYPGPRAGFTDPAGASFAIWQLGVQGGLDLVTAPNSLCWTELLTTDAAAATAFYRPVLGWDSEDVPMGGAAYTLLRPGGGGPETHLGGIMALSEGMLGAGLTPHWRPYFEVTDCDAVAAVAAERGGTVLGPPEDVESAGRVAALNDPFGAQFSVLTSAAS